MPLGTPDTKYQVAFDDDFIRRTATGWVQSPDYAKNSQAYKELLFCLCCHSNGILTLDDMDINFMPHLCAIFDSVFESYQEAAFNKGTDASSPPWGPDDYAYSKTLEDIPDDEFPVALQSPPTPISQSGIDTLTRIYTFDEASTSLGLSKEIEDSLSDNTMVIVRSIPVSPVSWSAHSVGEAFDIQAAGMLRVLCRDGVVKDCTVADFFTRHEPMSIIEQHVVPDNKLPAFVDALDHGYRYAWGCMLSCPIDLPQSVRRRRSWVSFINAGYSKKETDRDPTDGQCTVICVLAGSMRVRVLRRAYETSQTEVYDPTWPPFSILSNNLAMGDLLVLPPGMQYQYQVSGPTIIAGRYFYNYHTMHLAEVSRKVACGRSTNYPYEKEDCVDVHCTLCRMLIVLPHTDMEPLKRKELFALDLMVRRPLGYVTGQADCEDERTRLMLVEQYLKDVKSNPESNRDEWTLLSMVSEMNARLAALHTAALAEGTTPGPNVDAEYAFRMDKVPWYTCANLYTEEQWAVVKYRG